MNFFSLIFLTVLVKIKSNWVITPKKQIITGSIPTYEINLDLPVRERYEKIFLSSIDKIKKFVFEIKYSSKYIAFISQIGHVLIEESKQFLDPEWYEYIYTLSSVTNITLGEALMLSLGYDISCTSIIVQTKNNEIIHGRNLDFDNHETISDIAFIANYTKNGTFLDQDVELIGFRGGLNGIKPNKFSLSINLRYDNRRFQNSYHLLRSLAYPISGFHTPNYALMKVMTEANSFEEAEKMLSEIPLTSNAYFTLAGTKSNEGAIIARKQSFLVNITRLNVENGKWYVGVCNKDVHNENITDYRLENAFSNIDKVTRDNINEDTLFKEVMWKYPNFNDITCYTAIMKGDSFNITVWKK